MTAQALGKIAKQGFLAGEPAVWGGSLHQGGGCSCCH